MILQPHIPPTQTLASKIQHGGAHKTDVLVQFWTVEVNRVVSSIFIGVDG